MSKVINLKEARKELNKFRPLAKAIAAAADAVEFIEGREQNVKELEKLIAKGQTELANVNADITTAEAELEAKGRELVAAEEKVKAELAKAEEESLAEANEIMKSAKAEADKLAAKSKKLGKTIKEREAVLDMIEKQTAEAEETLAKAQKAVQDLFKNVS